MLYRKVKQKTFTEKDQNRNKIITFENDREYHYDEP